MNDTLQTLIRSVLKFGSAWLVTKGYSDSSTAEMISGGAAALAGVIWGICHRSSSPAPTNIPIKTMLFLLAVSFGLLVPLPACKNGPARIAYNTVATPAIAVDQAMVIWGDYVAQYNPGTNAESQVKAAFEKYQAAEVEAIDAAQAYAAVASSTNSAGASAMAQLTGAHAQQALTDLVNLLRAFGAKL